MSVVDPTSMRVHGLEGLCVVDASVMPYITNGNVYAPVGTHDTEHRLAGTRTFTSTSARRPLDRLGDPGGPPVVLLHGTPFSSYVWRAVAPSLARHHPVYVRDMPRYGTSVRTDRRRGAPRAGGRPAELTTALVAFFQRQQ